MRARKYRAKLQTTNDSWRVDNTYVKVKGEWMYLYRALDSAGNRVQFMVSPSRDAVSAKRFFRRALRARHTVAPRVINVDRNPAYSKAVGKLKKKGTLPERCEVRPIKYPNNLIEQDHRFIKRRTNLGMVFGSFDTAWRTLLRIHSLRVCCLDSLLLSHQYALFCADPNCCNTTTT